VVFGKWLLPGSKVVKILACIPARYSSRRFPGKVLARDTGKFLIQHTWQQACHDHKSGTDRIAEAVKDIDVEIVINLQADEPEIDPAGIDLLAQILLDSPEVPMATLAADFQNAAQIADANIVKVVTDCNGRALYFSRSPIPYDRETDGIGQSNQYLRHIGIYAYRKESLLKITALPQSSLEKIEMLEQLRAIENGFTILVGKTRHVCEGIDTYEQYAEFVKRYKRATEKKP